MPFGTASRRLNHAVQPCRQFPPVTSSICTNLPSRNLHFATFCICPQPLQPQLLLLHPRQHPYEHDSSRHNDCPQLYLKRPLVEIRLRCRRHRRETQYQQHIPTHPMILPHRLRVVHAPIYSREVVLRDSNYCLDEENDVGDEAQDGMGTFEVCAIVGDFVVFDDDEAREEAKDGGAVEYGVYVRALLLLFRGVGGLEDEDGLGS